MGERAMTRIGVRIGSGLAATALAAAAFAAGGWPADLAQAAAQTLAGVALVAASAFTATDATGRREALLDPVFDVIA